LKGEKVTVRIILADDHPMIRHGLRNVLNNTADFQVIGEASDGLEALQQVDLRKPDVLVVDLMMPNLSGLEVLSQVRKISPATHTIVFSMQSADVYVMQALRAGAMGYILKDTGASEIVSAIQSVMHGNQYVSERISRLLNLANSKVQGLPLDLYGTLTAREREVLQMTAEGKSSTEIGELLVISPRTVEIHRSRLMKKLNLRNQAELVRYAINRGILPLQE
jgi:DNA-binding NarL/FixJ family response regulator